MRSVAPGCRTRSDERAGDSPRVLDACHDLLHAVDGEELGVGEAGKVHEAAAERCGQPLPAHDRDERNRPSYRLW